MRLASVRETDKTLAVTRRNRRSQHLPVGPSNHIEQRVALRCTEWSHVVKNPVSAILKRCETGFTAGEKLGLTALAFLYLISPLDLVPDIFPVLGQCDDLLALWLLVRVWMSPTLGSKPSGPHCASSRTAIGSHATTTEDGRLS